MFLESETEEWKESWHDRHLATLCAFASYDGGTFIIGKQDKTGEISGVRNYEKLLEELPSTIRNKLGIKPSIKAEVIEGKMCIIIAVKAEGHMIDLDGRYYKRVGSTTHMITGEELRTRLLSSEGVSWTDYSADGIKVSDLSQGAINIFIRRGIESGRMSPEASKNDTESLLRHYGLMDGKGLKRSGAILFLEHPGVGFWGTPVKMGAFTEENRLLRHDRIDCPVIVQPDMVMDALLNKYVQGVDDIEWLTMVRKYPYPVRALREAIINAIIHRDYSSTTETYIRVYPNRVEISNPGSLPEGWTLDDLFKKHSSKLTNPSIAHAFYDIKYVERWGSGIELMKRECESMNLPIPEFNVDKGLVEVTFRLPEKSPEAAKVVSFDDLSSTELKIYTIIAEGNAFTREEIAESAGVSLATVKRTIAALTEKEFIIRTGSDKSGRWVSNVKTIR